MTTKDFTLFIQKGTEIHKSNMFAFQQQKPHRSLEDENLLSYKLLNICSLHI